MGTKWEQSGIKNPKVGTREEQNYKQLEPPKSVVLIFRFQCFGFPQKVPIHQKKNADPKCCQKFSSNLNEDFSSKDVPSKPDHGNFMIKLPMKV